MLLTYCHFGATKNIPANYLGALTFHGIFSSTLYVDTTDFSIVFGDYKTEDHDIFNVAYSSDPKSRRKDTKSVGLDAVILENETPFFF